MFYPYHTLQEDIWKKKEEGERKERMVWVEVVFLLQTVVNKARCLKFGTSVSVTCVTRPVGFQTGLLFFLASYDGE